MTEAGRTMKAGRPNTAALDAIFRPARIAVLGASSDPAKFGHRLVKNLRAEGFSGEVYPVNRNAAEIAGYATVPSLASAPAGTDLVLICVPGQQAADGVAEAAAVGAKAAIVYSAGFAEAGAIGRELQGELLRSAQVGGLRIIGPNCLGVRNFHRAMNAMPGAAAAPPAGPIAFVSQSGAFGNAACAAFKAAGTGMSKLASIGNAADVSHADLIRYFGEDDETSVIAGFVEGVADVDGFLDAIAAVSRKKPIVILKGGRTALGQAAALSHTSSLSGDGRIWDALLREAGANVAEGSEELFDTAIAFARSRGLLPQGRRAAIVTVAGGPSVVAADHCAMQGLELPDLGSALAGLRPHVARFASLRNPVDLTGQTARDQFIPSVKAVAETDAVDGVIGICIGLTIPELGTAMIDASRLKPVVTCFLTAPVEAMLAEGGVANFSSVERAVRAFRHLADRGAWLRSVLDVQPPSVSPLPLAPGQHSEAASKKYLASFGIPITAEEEVDTLDEALVAARRVGWPVVLKVSSPDIAHKSDVGGVVLNLADDAAFPVAFAEMRARFPGERLLVQRMVPRGTELIVGAKRSPGTGAVVMVGAGGVFTELLDDVAFCRAPASPTGALRAISTLRSQRLLDGYRGQPAIDRAAVAAIMATLSAVMAAHPDIAEVDLNPVIAWPDGAIVVDALVRVAAPGDGEVQ
jgi:acyl-CoA synthetase (NDP forming)